MLKDIATLSYAFAAAAFLFLSILLLTSWRGRLHGIALTSACLLTAGWAAVTAYHTAWGQPLSSFTHLTELMRSIAWVIFLLILLSSVQQIGIRLFLRTKIFVLALVTGGLSLLLELSHSYSTLVQPFGMLEFVNSNMGRVALAVVGMSLVEQIFRNSSSEQRWALKFACLGLGGLFAYDFYLYSDALLFRRINIEIWAARGIADALTVPLIAVSAARNPQWSLGIAVSRRMLFHSASLFGSAIYLLTMAAAGYYLKFFGGSWGTVMQVAFLFGAVILLVAILFSGAFRARLKVFISKHFYNYNYDYREEWIHFTRTLSEHGHGLEERIIQAIAALVESPGGVLFIRRDSGNCELAAQWNLTVKNDVEPMSTAFCAYLENKQWVVDLQDYNFNPDKYDNVPFPSWLHSTSKAWLVVPLTLHGKLFGFMVLAEPRSPIKLNWEVLDLLKIAGSQAASYLAQSESTKALMVARQFESFNRMSTFVVHDLKNLVSQLSLMISNAEKHKNNPEFQRDMIDTVEHSVQKMKLLLLKLSRGSTVEHSGSLFLDKLLMQVVDAKSAFEPKPVLNIIDRNLTVLAIADRLERVIGHLVQNAIEATPRSGQVTIRLRRSGQFAVIEIEDTGQGMSEEFIRNKLFQPFESTKSAGMGIGVFETREYVQELGGKLEVKSRPSVGTTFFVTLPLHSHNDHAVLNAAL